MLAHQAQTYNYFDESKLIISDHKCFSNSLENNFRERFLKCFAHMMLLNHGEDWS